MSSKLFTPLRIGGLELANRITVSPMCQYSAVDGTMNDWHLMHLGNLSLSGAGLLILEATHVTPEGRITHRCSGLYSDENEAALARVLQFCRGISPVKIGIQLAHAGRKGSAQRPWEGRGPLAPAERPWQTLGASAIPLAPGWPAPLALDRAGMRAVKRAFVEATRRAARIGFDLIEVHSAHGYLLNNFLSPLSNQRGDEYGGSLENRMRFPLEVFSAMRGAWPPDRPMGARIPGSDYVADAWAPEDAVVYARELRKRGCDYVTVSGGGVVLDAQVPVKAGYQVPFAERVRRETGIVSGAVGLITDPHQAEAIIANGQADYVSLARALLFNPRWPWHAGVALGVELRYPPQYERCAPRAWPPGRTLGRVGSPSTV
jgi:2,4-dienoyl-CoA reductase-like NADH-dependent reductase (Old Yellow Enzyme family)